MSLLEPVLTPWEHLRRQTHRDIDQTCDTWPTALLDAQARGYPTAVMQPRTSAENEHTSVEAAVIHPGYATAWIAELGDTLHLWGIRGLMDAELVRRWWHTRAEQLLCDWPDHTMHAIDQLNRLANAARANWPTPKPTNRRTTARSEAEETCGLCQLPAPSGRSETGQLLVRRIDGIAYHNLAVGTMPACYWVVWRQRRTP